MRCWQSWSAIVAPPAPEPMTTTQSRSSCGMGLEAMGKTLPAPCPLVAAISRPLDAGVGQPLEVGEAPLEVAALGVGRALPAEQRPDLRVVVEREDRLRAHRLEELGRAHAPQHLQRGAAEGLEVAQPLVELRAQAHVLVCCLEDGVG